MHRRDAIKSLAGLFTGAGLESATPVTSKAKLLILSVRPDVTAEDLELTEIKESIQSLVKEAGLPDVKVLMLNGFDVQVVNGD